MKAVRNLVFTSLAGVAFFNSPVAASPWIDSDDIYLRASIQQLADAGFLRGNVTTYPLMWSGIARDMRDIDTRWLTDEQRFAYHRVHAALQFAQQPRMTGVRVTLNSDEERQQSYADTYRENAALQVSRSFQGQHTAGRLRTTFRAGSSDDNTYTFDGSYLATVAGNWALSIDQIPLWWGPGQDSALAMSTNARPVQAIRINRLDDHKIRAPVLNWLGYWHVTGFVGRTQNGGEFGDHQIAGARLTLRPVQYLQLGASYTTQWGGDSELSTSPGERNQLIAADARVVLPHNLGFYTEFSQRLDSTRISDEIAWLAGIDHSVYGYYALHHIFVEVSDIPAYFYDDNVDPGGYRRWQQSIGAGQDQNVSGISLGYRYQHASGVGWRLTLRQQTFGDTNRLLAVRYSLTSGDEVERLQADLSYQFPLGDNLLSVGGTLYRDRLSSVVAGSNQTSNSNELELRASWEYRF